MKITDGNLEIVYEDKNFICKLNGKIVGYFYTFPALLRYLIYNKLKVTKEELDKFKTSLKDYNEISLTNEEIFNNVYAALDQAYSEKFHFNETVEDKRSDG